MGRTVTERTRKVVNSLLTLGLLEEKNIIPNRDNYSLRQIAEKLNKEDYQAIQPYISQIKEWIGNQIIQSDSSGTIFKKENLSVNVYEELIWTLLVLNMIVDEQQLSVSELNQHFGGKALSVITMIILAKMNNSQIQVKYENGIEEITLNLIPKKLYFKNKIWFLQGRENKEEISLLTIRSIIPLQK